MSKKRKLEGEDRRLHCICKQLDDGEHLMMQCDFCDSWFHPGCVGVDGDEAGKLSHWYCPGCMDAMMQNPSLTRKGLLTFQGRIAPKSGWGNSFLFTDIDEDILRDNIKTQRHRLEGYNLWREGKVMSLACTKSDSGVHTYFKGECMPSMKDKKYAVHICLKDGGKNLNWSTCSCPAGIDGECKHVVALIYFIIDLFRRGVENIPDVQTCTDKLQMWHVRKPLTDEPLLFSDISFVKHDPFKLSKKELGSTVKYHNPVPHFAKSVKTSQIEKLTKMYDNKGIKLQVIETIKSNNCEPVIPKEHSHTDLDANLFEAVNGTNFEFSAPTLSDEEQRFYNNMVNINLKNARLIEKQTRLQSKNSQWFRERQFRITSSIFGTFCRMKPTTDPVKTFEQKKLYFTAKSVRHGIMYENQAFAKYSQLNDFADSAVGLVVNPQVPFLGASPDRLVLANNSLKLVEIKCPFTIFEKKTTIEKHMGKASFYLTRENGEIILKHQHDYYYQIQGQLNLCGIETCDLVVFVPPTDMIVVTVRRDTEFFKTVMLPKLSETWFRKLLPHFLNN